jgi:hypothetical protein
MPQAAAGLHGNFIIASHVLLDICVEGSRNAERLGPWLACEPTICKRSSDAALQAPVPDQGTGVLTPTGGATPNKKYAVSAASMTHE